MTEKNMVRADFYTSIVLMAFGIVVTVIALRMPELKGQNPYSAPGLLPTVLGIVIFALSLVMFIRSLLRSKGNVSINAGSFKAFLADTTVWRIFLTIFICVLYAVLLGKVFFPLLTFLFIAAFVVCFEYDLKTPFKSQIKKILLAMLLAFVASAAVTAVFEYLFLVRLP
jgi:hypothetical protein